MKPDARRIVITFEQGQMGHMLIRNSLDCLCVLYPLSKWVPRVTPRIRCTLYITIHQRENRIMYTKRMPRERVKNKDGLLQLKHPSYTNTHANGIFDKQRLAILHRAQSFLRSSTIVRLKCAHEVSCGVNEPTSGVHSTDTCNRCIASEGL